jgi:hypothetical protein
MRSKNIHSDATGNGPDSDFINRVLDRLKELQFFSTETVKVEQTTRGTRFHAKPARGSRPSAPAGSFDIYDQTKSYATGDTFVVLTQMTIATITVAAGLYGVPSAGVDAQLARTWAGSVPASPTGNAVPQDPLPATGTCYALLIVPYCV